MANKKTNEPTENANVEITPSQYFEYLKGAKQVITTEALKTSYDVMLSLGEKYHKLGQKESLKRLCFLATTLQKEEKLIEMGITTYIYKDTIEDYIESVANKTVKIIELSRYMREIPDDLVEVVTKTRDIFDEFYVIFTDYTGKEERKVQEERRDKDPILFGVFKNANHVADRFYFLGDWVDEYCDLTLDKMVEQYKASKGYSPVIETVIPQTSDELVNILQTYVKDDTKDELTLASWNTGNNVVSMSSYKVDNKAKKTSNIISKVRSVFKHNNDK